MVPRHSCQPARDSALVAVGLVLVAACAGRKQSGGSELAAPPPAALAPTGVIVAPSSAAPAPTGVTVAPSAQPTLAATAAELPAPAAEPVGPAVEPRDTAPVEPPPELAPAPPAAPAKAPRAVRVSAAATTEGRASYYGRKFVGRKTASGERYDPKLLTAAHATLPLGTLLRVTRLPDGPSVQVRINDRCACTHGRQIDLSEAAARKLGMLHAGVVGVRLEVVGQRRMTAGGSHAR